MDGIIQFLKDTGIYGFVTIDGGWKNLIMIGIACLLCYLAIGKKFEPLLLLPIAIGMLLTNLPFTDIFHEELFAGGHVNWKLFGGEKVTPGMINELITEYGVDKDAPVINSLQGLAKAGKGITVGLLDVLYLGVKLGIYPSLIFLAIGEIFYIFTVVVGKTVYRRYASRVEAFYVDYAVFRLQDTPQSFGMVGVFAQNILEYLIRFIETVILHLGISRAASGYQAHFFFAE